MPIATNDAGEHVYLSDKGEWLPAQTAQNPQTKAMVVWDGKDWQTLEQKRSVGLKSLDDMARKAAQGASFGWADEISAKANELTGNGTYEENLAKENARNKEISPAIGIPAEIAGGLATTAATMPITGPISAATGIAKLPGWTRSILAGGAAGGLYGAGTAEPGERTEGAVKGAAIGAPAGLGGYAVGRAAGEVASVLRPNAVAAGDLARAFERDNITPKQFLTDVQKSQTVRPGVATAADVGGENVKGLVERIAQTPGAGRTTVVPFLTGRQQGQIGRISGDLSQLTGSSKTATQAITDTMADRSATAAPLYKQAFNFNARQDADINTAWSNVTATGWGQSILKSGEFRKNLQTEYGITDPTNAPLMVVIDAFKKQADDIVGNAIRNGNNNQARIVGDMRDKLINIVDQKNPDYAKARDAWAGPSRYLDAINEGKDIFNTKISAEQLGNAINSMSAVEREGYTIGAISAITGRMGNDPAKLADYTKFVRSPEMREKIAAIMPTPEAKQKWVDRLNFEVGSSELTGRALGNSATARRLAERQDADGITGDLIMDAFSHSPPMALLRRMVTAVPQKVRDTMRSQSDQVLAELLTDPNSMKGLVQAINRIQQGVRKPSMMSAVAGSEGTNALLK